jgi:hypothetical protein
MAEFVDGILFGVTYEKACQVRIQLSVEVVPQGSHRNKISECGSFDKLMMVSKVEPFRDADTEALEGQVTNPCSIARYTVTSVDPLRSGRYDEISPTS